MRDAEALRLAVRSPHVTGDLAGLLFGDADRFLLDLAMNLELRAALTRFGDAFKSGQGVRASLRGVLEPLTAYQQRVGFVDAYGGPLYSSLNEPLKALDAPGLNAVLRAFDDWRNPAIRNGIVPRLLAAIREYVAGS